jgi:6-phosphogluconate dehydrogenase
MNKSYFGVIGLGVMGQNLSLNIAEKGFSLSVYNRIEKGESEIVKTFISANPSFENIQGYNNLSEFILSLERPRKLLIMIKAGRPIDHLLLKLIPLLNKGDLIIDGGNSHFIDTTKRFRLLEKNNIHYIGAGISGGEKGARNGPSIMPGGSMRSYDLVSDVLEYIAAKDDEGLPCCTYIGADGSGHFIKMVHNGIEYAEMQLLAELFALMRRFMNYKEIARVLETWKKGELSSYLLGITIKILQKKEGDKYLLDLILDQAGNKGTGSWSGKIAFDLGVPATMMSSAVFARYISSFKASRMVENIQIDKTLDNSVKIDPEILKNAYQFARIINHTQGFELINNASKTYSWELNLSDISRIWSNGCIIKSTLMSTLQDIFQNETDLLKSKFGSDLLRSNEALISEVLKYGIDQRVALHTFGTALNYWIDMTSKVLPANLIQAQRDFFGSHCYQRNDKSSDRFFHTNWNQ